MSGYSTEVRAILASPETAAQWLAYQRRRYNEGLKLRCGLGLVGVMSAIVGRPDGSALAVFKPNGIVDGGFDFIANSIGNRAAGGATAAMGYIAIGTGTTAFAASQTALTTELVRQAATYTHVAGTKVFTIDTTFAAGVGTGAITESGVFNASSAGTMLDRVVFAAINKDAASPLTQTFTFTLS